MADCVAVKADRLKKSRILMLKSGVMIDTNAKVVGAASIEGFLVYF